MPFVKQKPRVSSAANFKIQKNDNFQQSLACKRSEVSGMSKLTGLNGSGGTPNIHMRLPNQQNQMNKDIDGKSGTS
tara:strand:- start:4238 stop:4465 length:228 start_codon:yes stop_codon:yes gene_type:complete